MLIRALCDYYDLLAREGRVIQEGYSLVKIQYRVSLTPEGRIDGIEDWKDKARKSDGKSNEREVPIPRMVAMFRRTEKPGIEANCVEHRPAYLFGLIQDPKTDGLEAVDRTGKAEKSHRAFVETNLAFIEGVDSPMVNAFRQFLLMWAPENETTNPFLLGLGKDYGKSGYAFCLSGRPAVMLQDDPELKTRWEARMRESAEGGDKPIGQCAVTGQTAEIARLHDKIGNVAGGLPTGVKLVCFDKDSDSFASYGAEQSLNSNVSLEAMQKYTQALNTLTGSPAHKMVLGDVTVIYFAMSADKRCDSLASGALFGDFGDADDDTLDAGETEKLLQSIFNDAARGMANAERLLREKDIDPGVDYYVVGFKPNSSRLAVQFIYRRKLGTLIGNAAQHQADMALSADAKPVALWQIAKQLVSPKATKQTVDSSLTAKLMDSIINGYNYPSFLLATVARRIRTDSDEENNRFIKINPVRAGLLKACLNRSARHAGRKEEIGMALDKDNDHPAYLCGRLFAVLERVQELANPGINRTITDAYFASASSRPALIFPRLIRLAQTHLKKIENPRFAGYLNRQIGEISLMLNSAYPDTLSLADQGRFDIGYYQQKYAPSDKKQADDVKNEEEK